MEILFELLQNEKNPAARAVLGHYFFVYIHPYMDGNGRIGRFLMNVMLVTGGYNWTIIRNSERADYMRTLDLVMIEKDIISFTKFVASELLYWKDYGNKKIREIGG
jgi:Fic family protein